MKHFDEHVCNQFQIRHAACTETDQEIEGRHEGRAAATHRIDGAHRHLARLLVNSYHPRSRENEILNEIFD